METITNSPTISQQTVNTQDDNLSHFASTNSNKDNIKQDVKNYDLELTTISSLNYADPFLSSSETGFTTETDMLPLTTMTPELQKAISDDSSVIMNLNNIDTENENEVPFEELTISSGIHEKVTLAPHVVEVTPPSAAKLVESKIQEIYKDQVFVGNNAAKENIQQSVETTRTGKGIENMQQSSALPSITLDSNAQRKRQRIFSNRGNEHIGKQDANETNEEIRRKKGRRRQNHLTTTTDPRTKFESLRETKEKIELFNGVSIVQLPPSKPMNVQNQIRVFVNEPALINSGQSQQSQETENSENFQEVLKHLDEQKLFEEVRSTIPAVSNETLAQEISHHQLSQLANSRKVFLHKDVSSVSSNNIRQKQGESARRPGLGQQRRQKLGRKVELSQSELTSRFQDGITISPQRNQQNTFRKLPIRGNKQASVAFDVSDILDLPTMSKLPTSSETEFKPSTPFPRSTTSEATITTPVPTSAFKISPPIAATLVENKIQEIYKDQVFVGSEVTTTTKASVLTTPTTAIPSRSIQPTTPILTTSSISEQITTEELATMATEQTTTAAQTLTPEQATSELTVITTNVLAKGSSEPSAPSTDVPTLATTIMQDLATTVQEPTEVLLTTIISDIVPESEEVTTPATLQETETDPLLSPFSTTFPSMTASFNQITDSPTTLTPSTPAETISVTTTVIASTTTATTTPTPTEIETVVPNQERAADSKAESSTISENETFSTVTEVTETEATQAPEIVKKEELFGEEKSLSDEENLVIRRLAAENDNNKNTTMEKQDTTAKIAQFDTTGEDSEETTTTPTTTTTTHASSTAAPPTTTTTTTAATTSAVATTGAAATTVMTSTFEATTNGLDLEETTTVDGDVSPPTTEPGLIIE